MSLPYVLAQGILVGKVMSDDKTNWKVLIPYTCQFLIGNVRPIDGAVRELKEETGVNSS